jgi:NADH oxidase (H2O2-forming)
MKVVIIGNGIAGNQVAFSVRERQPQAEIVILSAESVPEYDPCSLPYYLGGDCERKAVFRRKRTDYRKHRIDLRYDSKVVSISPQHKTVLTETGMSVGYDKLVLAHGGELFIPPIDGIRRHGVFSCKQLGQTQKLRAHKGRRAVVIGSGAIGIEAAEALKKKGYEVFVIELLDWILPALFDAPTAKRLEAALEGYGIRVHTGEKVVRIDGGRRVSGVVTDKRKIPCDTVVVATGVVAGVGLARSAGIATGRGIQVDRRMETSVPDIYACGDCVETVDACTGDVAMFQLKHNAIEQAQVAARNIAGEAVTYLGAYTFARAHFFDTHAAAFGKTLRGTDCLLGDKELIEKESGDDYLRVILLDGRVVGGQAIGGYADDIGLLIGAMWRRDNINRLRGKLGQLSLSAAACSWPQLRVHQLLSPGKNPA